MDAPENKKDWSFLCNPHSQIRTHLDTCTCHLPIKVGQGGKPSECNCWTLGSTWSRGGTSNFRRGWMETIDLSRCYCDTLHRMRRNPRFPGNPMGHCTIHTQINCSTCINIWTLLMRPSGCLRRSNWSFGNSWHSIMSTCRYHSSRSGKWEISWRCGLEQFQQFPSTWENSFGRAHSPHHSWQACRRHRKSF